MEHDQVRKSLKIVEGTGDVGQKQIAVMKIERRITANRFETNSRARKLRNSSSVKLATFPSLFSFSFLLSLSLSPSLSLSSPSLYFLLLFPYVARFQGRIHQLLLSLSLSRLSFSLLLLFFPRTPVSLLLPSHSLFGREHRRSGRCSFFLQTRERKLADLRAPSTHARSEAYRPEMLTLCRLRPKLLLATVSSRTLYRIIFTNHLER